MRADGLMTGIGRATFRGFLIGHQSMLESGVLVNTTDRGPCWMAASQDAYNAGRGTL